ncbi:MAG: VRR-NUC domain-containing protein [Cyanobacteria bacterium J06638_7]
MTERQAQQEIRLRLGARSDVRLFRSNTGQAWTGDAIRVSSPGTVRVQPGDVVQRRARLFSAGLCKGASDLIGWRVRTIAEGDIGQRVAQFAAIEVKGPRGRTSPEQEQLLSVVRMHGGISGVARSVEDAAVILGI